VHTHLLFILEVNFYFSRTKGNTYDNLSFFSQE
jgi:hypothetical protein